jgi:hypothetical protein
LLDLPLSVCSMVSVKEERRGRKFSSFGKASVNESFRFRNGGDVPDPIPEAILSREGDLFALLVRRCEVTDLKDSPLLEP